MTLSDAQAWATIFAASAIVFAVYQTFLQHRGSNNDQARLVRESTSFVREVLYSGDSLPNRRKALELLKTKPEEIRSDARREIFRFLSTYEQLALSANLGAVEDQVIIRMWGTNTQRDWQRSKDFVEFRRSQVSRPTLYCEFEQMVARWHKEQGGLVNQYRSEDLGKP